MSAYEYTVDILAEDGGPEPELRERFATIIANRLGQLDDRPLSTSRSSRSSPPSRPGQGRSR